MASIVVIHAHPYPDRSRANRRLLAAIRDLPGVSVRSLYDLYPDLGVDARAEQRALSEAAVIVWQHPLFWYSVPGLLKLWFDKVLSRGWAYGEGAAALAGKRCLWAVTTGGPVESYAPGETHGRPFGDFTPPIEQTARFCGMVWEEPWILHGAHRVSDEILDGRATDYRRRLEGLSAATAAGSAGDAR